MCFQTAVRQRERDQREAERAKRAEQREREGSKLIERSLANADESN
jgi:hypothetical protein